MSVKQLYIPGLLPVVAATMLLASCSNYQKVIKGSDYDKKYELAMKLYDKKDYQKAYPLLEELVSVYRGTARAENIYYYYCYSNYYLDDLISASYHFEQFAKTYPSSQRAEEAAYMNAYCYFLGSPEYSLDQSNSLRAIDELQLFINQYPNSTRIPECNDLIDKLRAKLERKAYETAMLYYKTMDYKAAIVALKGVLTAYPGTQYQETVRFTILKSHFLLAENSIDSKKYERYKQTMDVYMSFIDKFAAGKDTREAELIYTKAKARYETLKPQTSSN